MSESRRPQNIAEANAEIERLRARITDLESAAAADSGQADPIAIVGMGCRFPGEVDTPEAFWDLLASGRDVLGDIPPSRWDIDAYYDPAVPAPGKMYVRQGHYLDDIDQFDPHFFGLSPREARSLDPQQRLILEVTWETLEHAGIAASSLKGGKTGVFVGQYWDDYSMQRIFATDIRQVDRYAQLSGLRGLTAGRICHILDSHGPAMQVDTACSSSSLAVHLACQSLRGGESDLALAGGVSLILAPEHLVGVCQMQALSPSGRCKTFDADADGFGQGEGAGMIALKRLRDARAHGDRILAVIHGSCANRDGHARTVTTPSGPAQRAMLEDAVRTLELYLEGDTDTEDAATLRQRLEAMKRTLAENRAQAAEAEAERERLDAQRAEAERQREEAERRAAEERQRAIEASQSLNPVGWVVGGAGVAIMAGGLVAGVLALNARNDLEASCPDDLCVAGFDLAEEEKSVQRPRLAADILLFAGGATVVAGVILLFTGRSIDVDEDAEARTTGGFMCGPSGCSGSLRTSF